MANASVLSDGSLDMITEQKNDRITPLVQILGTKMMTNSRIRAVISDGQTLCQHCIFIAEDIEQQFHDGKLNKFSVVRLEQYSVSKMPNKDVSVILVNRMTLIKQGEEIDRKLGPGESFDDAMEASSPATTISSSSALSSSTFNRPPQSAQPKPAPVSSDGPSILRSENVCPITVLTPFFNAWVIRVRVTAKTNLKTYSNKKGEGKLFNFDCCDESGEIRITAFNAECDKFYDLIQPNQMYLISKGSIRSANKKFSSLNNDYEITLSQHSVIERCQDSDDTSIPKMRFKFINLADMNNLDAGSMVDVIGVIRSVGEPETLISKKTQKELIKKDICLVDKSLAEARITLWNDVASNFEGQTGQIMAMKGAMVGEFKGKTLATSMSTIIQIEPDIPETPLLRNWFNSQGSTANFTSLSKQGDGSGISAQQRFICQINPKLVIANVGQGQTYSSFNGMIAAINRSNYHLYKSCGNNGCQKKVSDESDGLYNCTKCDRTSPTFVWRLMISINVSDATGSLWVTLFQDQAEKLIGRSVQELAEIYEMDQVEYSKVINHIRFKNGYFRIGSRLDEYNNEQRLRSSAFNIYPHEPVARARRLMNMIDILSTQVNA